ncbi:MAG: hypothetical protein WC279_05790 [Sulfurimonas sp.]|jgi:hypothetical protein|uniref:hypothetical protein n=1 Tax=unclassified Sulfurimonas TaxID=2623549 RepID=UPI0008D473FB|nr:hypothetical protein [Sulfurimonas sp. RIFOXYB12_FULL_35_9]MBS4069342.1 hypothetical protein [Sulfurimonas sp.]OHE05555.1 MAG: hypothetical protein A2345_08930 [Sulfurimonas sp. RIFOXYB12_FULL_35_9]OHE15843.1 MAG: hypothetical protein A2329_05490 [Sulfurimonas sp. RIFOXYB2_FULL_37_5]OHE20649.1 MAG: hypothetical protein A2525_02175 [Sulfurimonas sp. RIFOXYD12_FULL_36_11]
MRLSFRIKHHFFSAFRELFVHHHSSLEFRARVFALVISANEDVNVENYIVVKKFGMEIYKGDEERANLLMLSTKELVNKVKENSEFSIDTLVLNIQRELKRVPRYAKKIDLDSLNELVTLSHDEDTIAYQKNIIEFLNTLKEDTLHEKKVQIIKDEEKIESKY